MLRGSRDAVIHKMQPISIHGQLSYDLHYRFEDDTGARIDRDAGSAPYWRLELGWEWRG